VPNCINGTFKFANHESDPVPPGLDKIFEKNKVKVIHTCIKESDVVILDLHSTPLYEAELIVNQLKDNFNQNTTIVILSTLMTWFHTQDEDTKDTKADRSAESSELSVDQMRQTLSSLYGEEIEFTSAQVEQF